MADSVFWEKVEAMESSGAWALSQGSVLYLCNQITPSGGAVQVTGLLSPVTTPTNKQAIKASHGLWIHALFLAVFVHKGSSQACYCLVWNDVHCWFHFLLICIHYFLWLCFTFVFFPRVSDGALLAWEPQENTFKCQISQQRARI